MTAVVTKIYKENNLELSNRTDLKIIKNVPHAIAFARIPASWRCNAISGDPGICWVVHDKMV
jgi:hypothetical protein